MIEQALDRAPRKPGRPLEGQTVAHFGAALRLDVTPAIAASIESAKPIEGVILAVRCRREWRWPQISASRTIRRMPLRFRKTLTGLREGTDMDRDVSYQEQLMQLRQERQQREAAERVKQLTDEWKVVAEFRDDAAVEGDLERFEMNDKDCEEIERELAKYAPPPQPAWLTEENTRYVQRCADLNTPVNDAKFRQAMMTAQNAGLDVSNHEVFKEVLNKFVSPGVFSNGALVPGTEGAIVPPDYQPMPDREEVFNTINATSKYGVKAEAFVRGEAELRRRKAAGHYGEK